VDLSILLFISEAIGYPKLRNNKNSEIDIIQTSLSVEWYLSVFVFDLVRGCKIYFFLILKQVE